MLFDGMMRFMQQSLTAIDEGDIEVAHERLHRTSKILLELLSTLREDKGGDVAHNLKKLYVYCYEKIVIGNLKKDKEMISEVLSIVSNLAEGWKSMESNKAKSVPTGMTSGLKITG